MKSYRFRIGIVGALFSTIAITAHAEYSVEQKLQEFHNNPKQFMNDHKNVQKFLQEYRQDQETGIDVELVSEREMNQVDTVFTQDSIQKQTFVDAKNQFHEGKGIPGQEWRDQYRAGRAELDRQIDNPEKLVGTGNLKYTTLREMEDHHLTSARLSEVPWSSYYWAIYAGKVANRYADQSYPWTATGEEDWKVNSDYILSKISAFSPDQNASSLDNLSPAEKYDLLVGDSNWTLTQKMLAEGKGYYEENGSVERWMGICHGWAPAAYMEKRPTRKISVKGWDGMMIPFYPSDIKALASLLWAESSPDASFIGSRCNLKNPETDENGRILAQECFDTNPGTWHQAVVNRIGVQHRSFVLDATYDYEVWNQPAYAYEYKYFNPLTQSTVGSWKDAVVSREKFGPEVDKFHKYRSPNAAYFVGIAMKFTYIAETAPNHSEPADRKVAVNYLYDLELDKDYKIIGGEWYHNEHPDFLWTPTDVPGLFPGTHKLAQAEALGDKLLSGPRRDHSEWRDREKNPIPATWRDAAIESSKEGEVLNRIVRQLVDKSHQMTIDLFGHEFHI